jgi:GNAT superfamily N-acetyltransferase
MDERPVVVRPATLADEAAVLGLIEELFVAPGTRPPGYTPERGRAGFRWAVAEPDADLLLAVADGRVVGLASVYAEFPSIRFGRRCWLEDLVVTASARRRGVGGRLLEAASTWGRARGCTHLELASAAARKDAHRFYLANGMAESLQFARAIDV